MSVSAASIGRAYRVGVTCLARPPRAPFQRLTVPAMDSTCGTRLVRVTRRCRWTQTSAAKQKQGVAPAVSTLERPPDGVWPGLDAWRLDGASANKAWVWGKKDAVPADADPKHFGDENLGRVPPGVWASPFDTASVELTPLPDTLAECADLILRTPDPASKAALSHRAYAKFVEESHSDEKKKLRLGAASPPDAPARPSKPELVHPGLVPSPKTCELGFSQAMMHNIAHIELNAIDLAWDTIARFAPMHEKRFSSASSVVSIEESTTSISSKRFTGLPDQFFLDFARVADDESRHLGWCLQRLSEMGIQYGDIPAHNLLWEGAESTSDSITGRLAVVPCMQEARGLDAGPRLVSKLRGRCDNRSADIIQKISTEELAHVAVGVVWFREMCRVLDVCPKQTFLAQIKRHAPESLRGPFNHVHRVESGLDPEWYSVPGIDDKYRMGHEFLGEHVTQTDDTLPEALIERLREQLRFEGVTEF